MYCVIICLIFFFNDTSTTEIYTLSLHDALPILLAFGPDGQPGIYSTENGERKAIAGMEAGEQPIGWTTDGASIYVYRPAVPARIFRVELSNGKRTLWKELAPADPVGVFFIRPPHIANGGKSYAYNYGRILS